LHQIPHQDRVTGHFSLLHTDAYRGTIRVQICWNSMQGAQRVVWWFWHILDAIDGLSPLCPYLLINRTEEAEGSNPSRSTTFYVFSSSSQLINWLFCCYWWSCGITAHLLLFIAHFLNRKYCPYKLQDDKLFYGASRLMDWSPRIKFTNAWVFFLVLAFIVNSRKNSWLWLLIMLL
jgi:hypothetical protein